MNSLYNSEEEAERMRAYGQKRYEIPISDEAQKLSDDEEIEWLKRYIKLRKHINDNHMEN